MLTSDQINEFIQTNNLNSSVVCLHSAYKSFGGVDGGPETIIDGFLGNDCTMVCPAFFYESRTFPPTANYQNNGVDYAKVPEMRCVNYQENTEQIEACMGAIPRALLKHQRAVRSKHAGGSFIVAGDRAIDLLESQSHLNVYSIYKNIYQSGKDAYIVLAGVDLTACTPVHFAEELAGRKLFRRWSVFHGQIVEIEEGSCSEGFGNLNEQVSHLETVAKLGDSKVKIYKFRPFIDALAAAIKTQPDITHCADPSCIRCQDMVAGGRSDLRVASR
ncbi:AAC(3) family N-acetyltransferase [Enterovibrio paralichthyis]|uniref:AAC(3) family N-acetyltransferase n=1 Tax=Enterovibrio paralichthyis TaxID=2853805 RepID=UPI001C441456|nr:AAC(3) family N-acetyltransferase [Enterovibrio paralichthyis]MBV7298194.1 AAC(3) family N-acetyltransferase [Enterovibrio paralichthyis]